MRMMGEQFVTGETIEEALDRATHMEAKGFAYSYDMLGEAATTAAAAATVTAAAATTTAIFAWLGFIDFQSTTADFLAIKLANSCGSLVVSGHLHKRKSTGASRFAIFDHAC